MNAFAPAAATWTDFTLVRYVDDMMPQATSETPRETGTARFFHDLAADGIIGAHDHDPDFITKTPWPEKPTATKTAAYRAPKV